MNDDARLEPISDEDRRAIFLAAFRGYLAVQSEAHAVRLGCDEGARRGVHGFDSSDIARDAVAVVRRDLREYCRVMAGEEDSYADDYLKRCQLPGRRPCFKS